MYGFSSSSSSSSSSLFPTATYIIIKHNTIQHNLQNTTNEHIDITKICVGKGVNRNVILIYGSHPTRSYY